MSKVSVIIPCYNQGHYLEESVDSVLAQSHKEVEIIIVNDGSTDENTNKIIAGYKGQKLIVIETQNQGLPEARNTGIRNAGGDFILPLDADNKIAPEFLKKSLEVFEQNSEVDIVYSDAYFFGHKQGYWKQRDVQFPLMLKRNVVDACALYKREVWQRCGGYSRNMLYGWEDWDFWLTALEKESRFYHIKEPLFYYRMGNTSMRDQIEIEKQRRIYLEHQLIKNHIDLYVAHFSTPLTMLRELDALRQEKDQFERYKNELVNSLSYRIGNALLSPFKWARKIASNKKESMKLPA